MITGDGTYLYAGSGCDGFYRSDDNGNTWTQHKVGLHNACITSILVNGSQIMSGHSEGGIYLSTDGGDTWNEKNTGIKNASVTVLAVGDTVIYAGTSYDDLHKSNDRGLTWTPLKLYNIGSPWTDINTNITAVVVNKNFVFAAGLYGIIRSSDAGQTWKSLIVPASIQFVKSIVASADTIWAGVVDGTIVRSTDNGDHWSLLGKAPIGESNLSDNCMLVKSRSIFVASGFGIFISRDEGATWSTDIGRPIGSLVTLGDNIFAGTDFGVYISRNNGVSWSLSSLSGHYITSLYVYGPNIYAGDWTNGVVFYSTDNGLTWTQFSPYFAFVSSFCAIKEKLFAGTAEAGVWSTTICNPPPQPLITKTYGQNGEIIFHSSSAQGNQWFLNGSPITGATDSIYRTTLPGKYTIQVTVASCKSIMSAVARCSTPPQPAITTAATQPTQVTLHSNAVIGNQWFLNGAPIPGATDSIYTATTPGDYSVQTSLGWCKSEMSSSLEFKPDPQIEMPNVFTPNDDDKNPVFKPKIYANIQSGFLTIINRWGKQVFETSNPESGWDGGKSEEGVYYYMLHYSGLNGKTGTVKGWVQIIR